MKIFHDVAELKQAVGSHLGYSPWHEVTQEQIDRFAQATGDAQWIHVDVQRAADGPFGSTIAHGYLVLSLVPMLVWQIYAVEGVTMGINYGADKLRFPAPVPAGAKIRAGVQLVSVEVGSGGHRIVARVMVERDGSDKPVCVVDTVSVLVA